MNMPDITKAQVVALTQAIIGVLVAFGAPITDAQSVAVLALVAVIAGVLIRSDADLRSARNYRAAQVLEGDDSEAERAAEGPLPEVDDPDEMPPPPDGCCALDAPPKADV